MSLLEQLGDASQDGSSDSPSSNTTASAATNFSTMKASQIFTNTRPPLGASSGISNKKFYSSATQSTQQSFSSKIQPLKDNHENQYPSLQDVRPLGVIVPQRQQQHQQQQQASIHRTFGTTIAPNQTLTNLMQAKRRRPNSPPSPPPESTLVHSLLTPKRSCSSANNIRSQQLHESKLENQENREASNSPMRFMWNRTNSMNKSRGGKGYHIMFSEGTNR
jgi:hypothetical protein